MPLSITLRRGSSVSPFRRQLLRLLQAPRGDSVILCTGFVTEAAESGRYRVLSDELLDALKSAATSRLEVYGAMLEDAGFRAHFERFVQRLSDEGLPVTARALESRRWHAKIAMRLDGEKPLAAIIGSSNLTGAAYGEPPPGNWNYECDVTLWADDADLNDHFRNRPEELDDLDFIAAILDPEIRQKDESTRLAALLDEIRRAGRRE